MVTAVLFTRAERRKQHKYLLVDEWINKMWYIHAMDYYSALKRKEIVTVATTWMNFEDIVLSKVRQAR